MNSVHLIRTLKKVVSVPTFLFSLFFSSFAFANNLVISNVSLTDRNASANTMVVQFDISWDHSWRKSDGRHDAAWVFVKIYQNTTAPWLHGKLYTAGTNPTGTSSGSNSDLKIVVPSDKIGAFISRTATGNGTFSSQKVKLVVDYGSSGIADTDTVQVKVFGMEMVYVPEGPFYVGDGDNPNADEIAGSIYGNTDGIISQFDSSGTFQWAKRLGGASFDRTYSVATDSNDNACFTGQAYQTVDLNGDGDTADSNEAGNTGVYGSYDVFLSVFDSAGTFQWSKRLGGTTGTGGINVLDQGRDIAVDSADNIIITGIVRNSADLNGDGDTADASETGGSGVYADADIFISKFNSAGTFQWSKRLGGTYDDDGNSVAVDSSGDIIVTGNIRNNADLNGDGDTADSNETGNTGVYASIDAFISKFNSAGTFQWSKRLGSTVNDSGLIVDTGKGIAVDGNDNIIVTGSVYGTADLNGDGDTADSNETGNTGVYAGTDVFISVFNSAGTFQWSKRLGGTKDYDTGLSVAVDNTNIIVSGSVNSTADLNGDGDTSDSNETGDTGPYGSVDGFISVFNSAGTFQWSKRLGGTYAPGDIAYTAADSNSNIIVTGSIYGNADLSGDGDSADSNETSGGVFANYDGFISVFDSSGTFQWSKRLGGTDTDSTDLAAVDSVSHILISGSTNGNTDFNGDALVSSTYGLYTPGADDDAVQITTSDKTLTVVTNSSDDIDTTPVTVTGLAGITGNTSWPNGYDDFYLMKYEITQGQYVDFLNTLSRVQQGKRVASTVSGNVITSYYVMTSGTTVAWRQAIRAPASGNGTSPTTVVFGNDFNANGTFNESDDGQTIAMNYLSWPDLMAYADWAGLRPMTELEYEKASHGPNSPTYGEYAWGTDIITQATSISNSGRNNENTNQAGEGLANYNNVSGDLLGPLRAGYAATHASNRKSAGAGYYGAMNLTDNVYERTVTLGNSTGRTFTGTHGDGTLTTTASFEGNATNTDWPGINGTTARGVTAASGSGFKGGAWSYSPYLHYLYVSDRNQASTATLSRSNDYGGRLSRTSP